MARAAIKSRKVKVGLHIDNAPPLGTRKPLGVMTEPGQDGEASDYPAKKSRKGNTASERSRAGASGTIGIQTSGKGRAGA